MAGCAPDQTDGLTGTRPDRRMLPLPWTLGFGFCFAFFLLPIRRSEENDIIPVLIGQQEGEDVKEDGEEAGGVFWTSIYRTGTFYFRKLNIIYPPFSLAF